MTAERAIPDGEVAAVEREHLDRLLDEALAETFPASDVVAISINHTAEPSKAGSDARDPGKV